MSDVETIRPGAAGALPADLAQDHAGVLLPAGEAHFVEMMSPGQKRYATLPEGRPAYQRHKYLAALELLPAERRRVFVDVGAHVGLWAYQAERDFAAVVSFEPVARFAALYPFNMRSDRWRLHRCALGAERGGVSLDVRETDTGCTHIASAGEIPLRRLDDFALPVADLVKIDVEGFELPVVQGAVETIARCRPLIVVEQKGNDAKNFGGRRGEAAAFLHSLGLVELRPAISGDLFFGFAG